MRRSRCSIIAAAPARDAGLLQILIGGAYCPSPRDRRFVERLDPRRSLPPNGLCSSSGGFRPTASLPSSSHSVAGSTFVTSESTRGRCTVRSCDFSDPTTPLNLKEVRDASLVPTHCCQRVLHRFESGRELHLARLRLLHMTTIATSNRFRWQRTLWLGSVWPSDGTPPDTPHRQRTVA